MTANPNPASIKYFKLMVSRLGDGLGSVSSDILGISCGADCAEDFASGKKVTLTATASAGSSFVSWDGDCKAFKNISTCVLEMKANKVVSASFKKEISTPPVVSQSSFSCLEGRADIVTVTGFHDAKYIASAKKDRAFDARTAEFLIKYDPYGIIEVEGNSTETGMCWAGGYIQSDQPWNATWADHKATDGQPTRNSSVIDNIAYKAVVTGLHFFNVHDGPKSGNAFDWQVQHVWGQYIRDDSVENDHMHSGRVFDSLFDGTYSGISTRPSSSSEDTDTGLGQVIQLEKVLLRLQAMPYPYSWESKSGNITSTGAKYTGSGVPYSHAKWFKYYDEDNSRGDRDTKGIHFSFKDIVLAGSHSAVASERFNMPSVKLIDRCENVTIAWLGDDAFPLHDTVRAVMTAFPGCITVLQGAAARNFWKEKVVDWHNRHLDVGPKRKPANPGEIVFPQMF